MKMKKLLSVILAAVMLLGCMSVTAFAAGSPDLSTLTTGAKIQFGTQNDNPVEWVIGGDGTTGMSVPTGCIALVTSGVVASGVPFDTNGSFVYASSNLRSIVKNAVTFTTDEQAMIQARTLLGNQPYGNNCDGVAGDSVTDAVWALTSKDAGALGNVNLCPAANSTYWLCSRGGEAGYVAIVGGSAVIPYGRSVDNSFDVRAALYLDLSKVTNVTLVKGTTNTYILNAPEEPTDPNFTIDANGVLTAYTGEGGDIVIPNGVTAIGDEAFRYNDTITGVVIPEGVTSIGEYAFYYCESLTSVTIPSTVTTIGQYAFDDCVSLTGVTIPEGVTSIGEGAFWSTGLTEVTIPASVTEIGERAFYDCSGLTSVTIPASVTTIGSRAFGECSNLTDATLCWTNEDNIPTNNNAFAYIAGEATLHVPKGMTQAYADKGWGTSFYKGDDMNNIIDDAVVPLSSFTLSKDYNNKYSTSDSDAKSTKVSETLSFTITPVDDAPAFANSGAVSMTVTKGVGSAVVALPTFPSTGDFWYTITETASSTPTAGVTYNDATYYLHLVVYKIDGAYRVVSAAIHTTAPVDGVYSEDDKVKSVSNSYGEGSLTVGQVTTINGEDSSEDTFEATVTFTIPEGTVLSGDITYGDNQKVTFDENGVGTVVIELKGGDTVTFTGIPEGVTYTVTQTDGNEDEGYALDSVEFDNDDEDGDEVSDANIASGTVSDAADTVTITNVKTVPIDVGVILENGAFIVLALGAIAAAAWLIASKRRKSVDAEL